MSRLMASDQRRSRIQSQDREETKQTISTEDEQQSDTVDVLEGPTETESRTDAASQSKPEVIVDGDKAEDKVENVVSLENLTKEGKDLFEVVSPHAGEAFAKADQDPLIEDITEQAALAGQFQNRVDVKSTSDTAGQGGLAAGQAELAESVDEAAGRMNGSTQLAEDDSVELQASRFSRASELGGKHSDTVQSQEMGKALGAEFKQEYGNRFLDSDSAQQVAQQVNKMNGQANIDSIDEGQMEPETGQAEWSRLLQRSMTGAKPGQSAVIETATASKLGSQPIKQGSVEGSAPRTVIGGPALRNAVTKAAPAAAAKQAQAPTPGQLPEGVDELSILRQISDGLRLKGGRTQRAEIRLNPAELGTVEIRMEMKGDSVRVFVAAEHAAVGDLLSNGLEQLRKDILAQGMHLEHIEVKNELAGQGGQDDQSDGEEDETSERDSQTDRQPITRRHDGRLHVRA